MIIKKQQTTVESFAKGSIWDYPIPDEQLGISYQEHNGRVPEKGWGMNTVCFEAYYIIGGTAEVCIDDEQDTIQAGDVVILKPGSKSYLIADHLRIVTITQPNWYKEQYKEIP